MKILLLATLSTALVVNAQDVVYIPDITENLLGAKAINSALPVGAIAGVASVSPTGGATYSVPLIVPPAANGFGPSLSLVYNSQGGDGPLGMGWSLSGASAITRVGSDYYHDGKFRPVDFSISDHFALDGQRLVPTNNELYGSANAVYDTEKAQFLEVSVPQFLGGEPDHFRVMDKSGVISYYGLPEGSSTSRITNAEYGGKTMAWLLASQIDPFGNRISYEYCFDSSEPRLCAIRYDQDAQGAPRTTIAFEYKTRSDAGNRWSMTQEFLSLFLLTKVSFTASIGGTRSTLLNYAQRTLGRSFLAELKMVGADGLALNSTVFNYGEDGQVFDQGIDQMPAFQGQNVDLYSGDFDGNGVGDILAADMQYVLDGSMKACSGFRVFLNGTTSDPFVHVFPGGSYFLLNPGLTKSFNSNDVDGDGRADIVVSAIVYNTIAEKHTLHSVRVFYSLCDVGLAMFNEDTISFPPQYSYFLPNKYDRFHVGDFNGDGRAEISFFGVDLDWNFGRMASWAHGGVWTTLPPASTGNMFSQALRINPIDINGDGQLELHLRFESPSNSAIVRLNALSTDWDLVSDFSGPPFIHEPDMDEFDIAVADLNGDGNQDVMCRIGTTFTLYPSNGVQFGSGQIIAIEGGYQANNSQIVVADFNGDGRSDIFHGRYASGGSIGRVGYSKGPNPDGNIQFEWHSFLYSANFTTLGIADLNGDGRAELLNRHYYLDPVDRISFGAFSQERTLQAVKDGLLNTTRFVHQYKVHPEVYQDEDPTFFHYPQGDMEFPMLLVRELIQPDGVGGTNSTYFEYEDAFGWRDGGGFNGFMKQRTYSEASDLKTETINEWQGVSGLFAAWTRIRDISTDQWIRSIHAVNGMSLLGTQMKRHRSYASTVTDTDELAGVTTITNYVQDICCGNVQSLTTNIPGIVSTTKNFDYGAYGSQFPFGYANRLERSSTTVTREGMPTLTSEHEWEYEPYTGAVKLDRAFSNTGAPVVREVLARTGRGEVERERLYTVGMAAEEELVIEHEYDPFRIGPVRSTKQWFNSGASVPVVQQMDQQPMQDGPTFVVSSDGLKVQNRFDGFGRVTHTSAPAPNEQIRYWVSMNRVWDATSVIGATYYVEVIDPASPRVRSYYDALDRSVETWTVSLSGQWIKARTEYDGRGRIERTLEPKLDGETPVWLEYTYDGFDRPSSTSHPAYGTTTMSYSYSDGQLTTTTTNAAGRWSAVTTDATGLTIATEDDGGRLIHTYDSNGQLLSVLKDGLELVRNTYDEWDHQTSLTDWSAGFIEFEYDPLGRLQKQISANGDVTKHYYDNLGRTIRREDVEGVVEFTYQLAGAFASDRVVQKSGYGVVHRYEYNVLGLLEQESMQVDEEFGTTRRYSYDPYDRLAQTDYVDLTKVAYGYNNGHLSEVYDPGENIAYWKGLFMDGHGHYTNYALLDGVASDVYTYDRLGRSSTSGLFDMRYNWDHLTGDLLDRWDAVNQRREYFTYDALDRLKQSRVVKVNSGGTTIEQLSNIKYLYDGSVGATHGNLVQKDDVGKLPYYAGHALTGAVNAGWPNNSTSPPNLINLETQEVKYTSYHQPYWINEKIGGETHSMTIVYGPDQQRVRSKWANETLGISVSRLYDGDHERQQDGNGSADDIIYVQGGHGLCAMIVFHNGDRHLYAVHTDHLGSIALVTEGVAPYAQLVARQSFDAWGRPRSAIDWSSASLATPAWLFRGYTGHEHLYAYALINMNGRLYDPVNGRMLSADNFTQGAFGTQGFNRYSYAANNPLRYTDPSGEFVWWAAAGFAAGAYFGGAIAAGKGGIGGIDLNPFDDSPWKGTDWWKGSITGGLIGASIGLGVAAGVGAAGTGFGPGFATAGVDAASVSFNVLSNGLINSTMNVAATALQGGGWDEAWSGGLIGFASGLFGGGAGALNNASRRLPWIEGPINLQNALSASLNGFGLRYKSSGGNVSHAILGASEGLYLSTVWGNKLVGIGGRGRLLERFTSSAGVSFTSAIPGLGVTLASYHYTALSLKALITGSPLLMSNAPASLGNWGASLSLYEYVYLTLPGSLGYGVAIADYWLGQLGYETTVRPFFWQGRR